MVSPLKAQIIVCELSDNSIDRLYFTNHLKLIGEAKHLFESTWLLQTAKTCEEVLDFCQSELSALDNLLVLNIDKNFCWSTSDSVSADILLSLKS